MLRHRGVKEIQSMPKFFTEFMVIKIRGFHRVRCLNSEMYRPAWTIENCLFLTQLSQKGRTIK